MSILLLEHYLMPIISVEFKVIMARKLGSFDFEPSLQVIKSVHIFPSNLPAFLK